MTRPTQHNLIILEGGIAAGKTTLLKTMEKTYGYYAIEEPVIDNPFLEKFYKDPMTYAFPFQMWFLDVRVKHYSHAVEFAKAHPETTVILDRSVFSDYVFALNCHNDGFISDAQFAQYMERYTEALLRLPNPAAMLYLDVPPEVCLNRILNVRRRECEKDIPLSYLTGLHDCYKELIRQMRAINCRVEIIDWSQFGSAADINERCALATSAV